MQRGGSGLWRSRDDGVSVPAGDAETVHGCKGYDQEVVSGAATAENNSRKGRVEWSAAVDRSVGSWIGG